MQSFKNQMLKLTSYQVYNVKTQLDVTKEILRKWPAREFTVRGIEMHRFVALCNIFKTITKFDHTGQNLCRTALMTDQWMKSLQESTMGV